SDLESPEARNLPFGGSFRPGCVSFPAHARCPRLDGSRIAEVLNRLCPREHLGLLDSPQRPAPESPTPDSICRWPLVPGAVLAAGRSSRMGRSKALLPCSQAPGDTFLNRI